MIHKAAFIDMTAPLFLFIASISLIDVNHIISIAAGLGSVFYSGIRIVNHFKNIKNNKTDEKD